MYLVQGFWIPFQYAKFSFTNDPDQYFLQQREAFSVFICQIDSFNTAILIYKLNNDATAIEIRQQDFGNLPAMRNWTLERFRQMCILSGCDYLASPPGIGVITAAKLLKKTDAYNQRND